MVDSVFPVSPKPIVILRDWSAFYLAGQANNSSVLTTHSAVGLMPYCSADC